MRFAYADPPYIGCSNLYPEKREVDHGELVGRLVSEFDGWALSCSVPSLRVLLPLVPEDARIMAWVKPFAVFKPNVNPAYAWEPVIVWHPRKRTREQTTTRDWVSCNVTLRRGLVGAKPREFCFWLFEVLNLQGGDEFVDLYPGTEGVTTALDEWRRQLRIA